MGYRYVSDKQKTLGYIDKKKILTYVSEEEIFSLVFGFLPREMEYVTSPFRNDSNPMCYFERRGDNLRFIDFADGTKMFPDCFDAVQRFFNLPNFYKTLDFIYKRLMKDKELVPLEKREYVERKRTIIDIQSRNFIVGDAKYWQPYEITRQNLVDDLVFPVSKLKVTNSKYGDYAERVKTLCYAYTDFPKKRKKLYYPKRKEKRFITNCSNDDIGCLKSLAPYGRQLIISKSYKDCRVLRNQGRHSIWFQNEGVIPDEELVASIVKRFDRVVVFYDNDTQGPISAKSVSSFINSIFPGKSRPVWLPEHLHSKGVSDPADMINNIGKKELRQFLHDYLL